MKNILFINIILLSIIFLSCKKGSMDNPATISRLMGMRDSGMLINFTYTAGKISHATYKFLNSVTSGDYANFEYMDDNDIKVSAPFSELKDEFFLNGSKLPLHMTGHETGTDGIQYNKRADFFYKAGTNTLDSVNGYYSDTSTLYVHFTFAYDGENISKATREYGLLRDTFTYAYDVAPNLFRNSDPLLYIYADLWDLDPLPYNDYPFFTMVFFFPKVFSAATLNSFSYTHGGSTVSGKLNYTLSNDNKILKEWYGGYAKEYFYK